VLIPSPLPPQTHKYIITTNHIIALNPNNKNDEQLSNYNKWKNKGKDSPVG
jgi:hypothetical protein